MRYGLALSLLLGTQSTTTTTNAFQFGNSVIGVDTWSSDSQRRAVLRQVSAYAAAAEGNPTGNVTANGVYLASLVTDAVQTDDDAEEIELAKRRRKITERSGTYRVTLPLAQKRKVTSDDATVSQQPTVMGMTIRQFSLGAEISNQELNLDSLVIETAVDDDTDEAVVEDDDNILDTISAAVMQQRLNPEFSGVYVSSVAVQSPAWKAGIRAGDLLAATAATFGEALWPKTTLEGVRSALTSRRIVADTATFELRRTDVVKTDNVYELTLCKPIGLNLKETEDGYVEVVGFTVSAPTLIRQAVRKGDRVIAVDSTLGDQMWPVSTVEGVISACTSRLPGQQITMRFERPEANLGLAADTTAVMEQQPMPVTAAVAQQQQQAQSTTTIKEEEKQLLKRCRDILRRYAAEEEVLSKTKSLAAGAKFFDKFAVPAMVADRVMEALAKASATLDSVTLSMTMDAYLSCNKPNEAIRAFEAAVGINGDGSILPVKDSGDADSAKLAPNPSALNVYTISSLLKAHAMKRDLKSVRRVVAAMEGRGGEKVSGLETAYWPGTGGAGAVVPDTQCYNIAISAAAKVATAEGLQLAMKLFNTLRDPTVIFRREGADNGKPEKNTVTYNSIISALTLAGKFDDAFNIFFTMKRVGLKPDKFTYTSLLKACVNDGDLQELLYDMREQGVKDDVVMYNAMIRNLCDEGKLSEARTLITQMESRGVSPDSRTYGNLMKGLLRAGKPGACLALFETACNNEQTSKITENVYLYTTAVSATSQLGDHERALDLVSRMSAIGIRPNTKTLTALMGACLANNRPDLAAEVYKKIDSPDGYAMSQGVEAFCKSGDLASAAELLASQKRGSRSLSGKQLMQGYETVVSTAVRYGEYDVARSVFKELLDKSYIPSKAMLRHMIAAMGLVQNGKLVLEYVERSPEQFEYLLFLIDSAEDRKLAVDSYLYAATIACGNQLGAKYREVASLLMKSKAAYDEAGGKVVSFEGDSTVYSEPLRLRWEEVLQEAAIMNKLKSSPALLPSLAVTVSKRDARAVFFAEKFMSRPKQTEEKVSITP